MRQSRLVPGRRCPLHYRYRPEVFRRAADIGAETLYVIGGLYGNPEALAAVLELARAEPRPATLVFNGDFHWFDADLADFARVQTEVLRHVALRGNVETELAMPTDGAGCGCGYPAWVGDAEVERSNSIMVRLQRTAAHFPRLRERLAALPMHLVADVGSLRIGIAHGDAESLAGWRFSQEMLGAEPDRARVLLARAGVRVFACSHTCLPVMREFELRAGRAVVANNGAAGMPNFRGEGCGVITRISIDRAKGSLYGLSLQGVHLDALALRYDQRAWLERFERAWPPGSAAALSYRRRIECGPDYGIAQASGASGPHPQIARRIRPGAPAVTAEAK